MKFFFEQNHGLLEPDLSDVNLLFGRIVKVVGNRDYAFSRLGSTILENHRITNLEIRL